MPLISLNTRWGYQVQATGMQVRTLVSVQVVPSFVAMIAVHWLW